ncbi:uncharacterized protein PRCAT00003427001 [Priceomyces carsonii]|uniref:uncharacterized protein n=1 Tax=Priceomyces carsonii TaxID=28549 RepID=UPI002ED8CC6F|nr:unnamed protein product [Priceomyces carsonii]
MDAWTTSLTEEQQPSSNVMLQDDNNILNYSDPLLSKILRAKKELHTAMELKINDGEGDESLIELLVSACDGDLVTLESLLRSKPGIVDELYPEDSGVTSLVCAICFDNYEVVDSLLSSHGADPDICDTIVHYTPMMWAVYLNQLPIVKLLMNQQADPYLSPENNGKNAITLLNPENTLLYEYFKSHNLLQSSKDADGDDFFRPEYEPQDPLADELSVKLKLQSIANNPYDEEDLDDRAAALDEEAELSLDPILVNRKDFEYDKLISGQYIKFTDSDIPSLLDYIFKLRTTKLAYQHDSKVPAAIVFQLIRYSHLKVKSDELTEFLFECFSARLRSVTNTKSGVFNMATTDNASAAAGAGDIVLLSYWLSSLQFLHFYFSKNDIYISYPKFLQEIINLVQSLIATLSFSINSRLNLLLDDCLLNFTSLVDVSNVLYEKDWNFFKNKKKHPFTYDDIYEMLYPPSQTEQMKPSPIRYIQVLGALDYVLKIHEVDKLFRVQTFSQVFYYINAVIFNRLMSNAKYCSRAKAIQIRLNISTLEDWLRSHNYKIYRPEVIGHINKLVGDTNIRLHNIFSEETEDKRDPHTLAFYYNSLYHVGKIQLQPTFELLQWLQCMSLLLDEESLIITINQFDALNYYQLYKVIHKLYRYEVDEPKIPKKLINVVKALMNEQGEKQIERSHLHYMTQSTFLVKELYIYLNPNYIFEVALPNLAELISNYGSGIGGVKIYRSRKYQPSLPIAISDDIEELLSSNRATVNDDYDYEQQRDDYRPEENNGEDLTEDNFKGDEMFKQVQLPNTLVHKEWGDEDIDTNPW